MQFFHFIISITFKSNVGEMVQILKFLKNSSKVWGAVIFSSFKLIFCRTNCVKCSCKSIGISHSSTTASAKLYAKYTLNWLLHHSLMLLNLHNFKHNFSYFAFNSGWRPKMWKPQLTMIFLLLLITNSHVNCESIHFLQSYDVPSGWIFQPVSG